MKTLVLLAFLLASWSALAQDNDALIKACLDGDLAAVKKNVEGGSNINYKNASGQTPVACAFLWPEITQYLLEKGADANSGDFPALVNASKFYSVDVMKILLKAGADPNKPATVKVDLAAGARAALEAEKAKGKKANKMMIKIYEDQIKTLPANSMTFYSIGQAVSTNCKECVDVLLIAGAKPNDFKNSVTGGGVYHELAATWIPNQDRATNNLAAVPYMEKAGVKMPEWYKQMDFASAETANEIVYLLKSNGADIEALDNQKQTPLKAAFARLPAPNEEVVTALVNNGASIKATGLNMEPTAFAEATDNPEKIKVKFDFPREGRTSSGGGYSANMSLLNPKPKKIALISYYVYDAGNGKSQGSNFAGNATTTAWRTSDFVAQNQADGFYAKSIEALKASFKANGMDLLTPDQFLDTGAKKDAYYSFDQETAKNEKTSARQLGKLGTNTEISTIKASPSGKGFRPFFLANEPMDQSNISNFQGGVFSANRKLTSSLGYELTKLLEVDAVVVVYIVTRMPKMNQEDYSVNAVVTMMLGPNPGKSDDPEAKNLGQFYCGTRTYYQSPLIFKDNKSALGQYDGMANILSAHGAKIGGYVNGKEKDEE